MRVSVLTYNVWFDGPEYDERLCYNLNLIKKLDPDIIFLQEVKYGSYSRIRLELSNYNCVLDKRIEFNRLYGEMILTKFSIRDSVYVPYKFSPNIRGFTINDIRIGENKSLKVITTHMEITRKRNTEHLEELSTYLTEHVAKEEKCILGGDFNRFNGKVQFPDFKEIETKNTFENETYHSRPDRFLYRNVVNTDHVVIQTKVGSDHYPLFAEFDI